MSSSLPLRMTLPPAYRNQRLFSDHFLEHALRADPRWEEGLSQSQTFLTWLRRRYIKERRFLSEYREQGLEGHWFRPILRQLGHVFVPEPTVPGLNTDAKRPDYVFFADHATRREAAEIQDRAQYAQKALAVGEVKDWDTRLGKHREGGGSHFEDRNPSWQIDHYLHAVGVDWGILSNGRLWRLFHRGTSRHLQTYYEVDLVRLIEEGDPETLNAFTLFFRQDAFRPDERGRVFLDDVLTGSQTYAVELEADLKENARRALQRLMQGFMSRSANRLKEGDLKAVYDNSLYLLYRLLFILCGESRGLLPLGYDQYRSNYSLTRIREEIAGLEVMPAPGTALYWGQLKNLFQIVNGSYPKLNRALQVPRYNGGLFDPEQHPFLEDNEVGDRAIVEVIDLLSRRATKSGPEFIDYRTVGTRHVGSIYEGLLGYRPRMAREPMVAIRQEEGERWIPASESPRGAEVTDRRERGQLYLETGEGLRSSAGSYDTPKPIVETIVAKTVGPLVEEARVCVQDRAEVGEDTESRDSAAGQSLVDHILGLKVLDLTMGSGHFLVEATEYLALALTTDPRVRAERTPEDDLSYWKRRVVERCIYGVDKNPLAVELAKLSLWLATVAADRPLSFLDHHLRCGDALIGARVEDLGWAPPPVLDREAARQVAQQKAGQINMFEHLLRQSLPKVMRRILEITAKESRDYDTVQAKQASDRAAQELSVPFDAVADLWTSAYFDNDFHRGDYQEALGVVSQPDTLLQLEAVKRARRIAEERRFFHWELAFPELFYEDNGQPLGETAGFDAVVGNTPWGAVLSAEEREYLQAIGFICGDGEDHAAFCTFTERGLGLLSEGRHLGFIVPNACLSEARYGTFRARISETSKLCEIVDFMGVRHFDVDVSTCILVLEAGAQGKSHMGSYVAASGGELEASSQAEDVRVDASSINPWLPERPADREMT